MSREDFLAYRVPSITTTRKKLVDLFEAIEEKISLNRRMNGVLEGVARALFRAWFVDFEPVKAKAAGAARFPGMPQAVFDALPSGFRDSEIGEIPEGWEVVTVGEAGNMSRDSVTPSDHADEVFEHYSIPAFDSGQNPVSDMGTDIKSNKYVVTRECVLVSKLNPRIPRVWLPDQQDSGHRRICSTEFLVVSPTDGWSRELLYCQFKRRSVSGGHGKEGFRNFQQSPAH